MENEEKNIMYVCDKIKSGELYPINLYKYKITCNCKDTELGVFGGKREDLEKEFDVCPTCKGKYKISDGLIHSDTATLVALDVPDNHRMPCFILANVKKEHIDKLEMAGKDLIKNRQDLVPLIYHKIEILGKKSKTPKNK